MPENEIQELHAPRKSTDRLSASPNHHGHSSDQSQGHHDYKVEDNRADNINDDDSSSKNSYLVDTSKRTTPANPGDKRYSEQSNASSDDGRVRFSQGPSLSVPQNYPVIENLARASWTTASFTEVPNALDELTQQHHPSRTSAQRRSAEPKKKISEVPNNNPKISSAGDLHSILVKHGQPTMESTLTKYLRPTMLDEGTQSGIPSWDWLSRLEQMLIHFFLMIFESSNDSTKLVMEMMPSEAGQQVEEIFQLLLKAEPDMYKELGHLVHLAEKWLIHWKGDSEERQKALNYVRLYMQGVKDKNYYRLPIQVRLHKLGAFIVGLKKMNKDVASTYPIYVHRPPINQTRIASPRVKPGTHFSRVVANILCGRSCDDPFPIGDIYADKFGRKVFQKPLHGAKEIRVYTDEKYGNFYTKKDLFRMRRPRKSMRVDGGVIEIGASGDADEDEIPHAEGRDNCVRNLNCWVPMYTKAYVQNLKGNGCEVFAKADFARDVKIKACKSETCANAIRKGNKSIKKLYEWVRGDDGKVHRRPVGSYTELGVAGSIDRIPSRGDRSPGRAGTNARGKRFNNKTFGGGTGPGGKGGKGLRVVYSGKAASDTQLDRDGYGYAGKGEKDGLSSKGKERQSVNKGKAQGDSEGRSKKRNRGGTSVYRIEGMSIDGSGDSAHEELEGRRSKYGLGKDNKRKQQGGDKLKDRQSYYSQNGARIGKYSISRYGSTKGGVGAGTDRGRGGGYGGPNNGRGGNGAGGGRYDGGERGGYDGTGGRGRYDGERGGYDGPGGRGRYDGDRGGYNGAGGGLGAASSSSRRDKEFIDLFSKSGSHHNRRDTVGTHKTYQSYRSHRMGKLGKYLNDEYEGEGLAWSPSSEYYNLFDKEEDSQVDDPAIMTVNQCWERASKLFKKPNKALVIAPPENLAMYLERKYPKSRWPKGTPIASRNYPNGSVFVSQSASGSSRVFYPHGGLALIISAPSPATSRVLVVRDPSDHNN